MLEIITAKSKTFKMINHENGRFTQVTLELNANAGNSFEINIDNSEKTIELINEISKIFKHITLEYTTGEMATNVIIKDVDYMDLTQAGSLKRLNNIIFEFREEWGNVVVAINGKLTSVGTVK